MQIKELKEPNRSMRKQDSREVDIEEISDKARRREQQLLCKKD